MRTASRLAAPLILALTLLAARPAGAQLSASVGAHLGYSKTKGVDNGSFIGGAQFRLRLLSFIGAEALAEYRTSTYQAGGVDVLRVRDFPIQLSAMLYLIPAGPVQIYGLGGYGSHYTTSTGLGPNSGTTDASQTKWSPHVGGGVEIWTSQNFFLTGDIRYTFLSIGSLADVENQYRTGSLSANYWSATAGLNYKF